jgi:hypothetical protein
MGLLDEILPNLMSASATFKRRIRGLIDDPSGTLQAITARGQENAQAHMNALTGQPYNPQYDADYKQAMQDAALAAMTVYHGSPHKFDKFDMSKIGTGEGAQAYGHGLYMAEKPGVADEYATKLSEPITTFGGKQISEITDPESKRLAEWIQSNVGVMQFDARQGEANRLFNRLKPEQQTALGKPSVSDAGNLYKVDIPDEAVARFLDWDKPLSEQQHIQRALLNQDDEWAAYASNLSPGARTLAEDMVLGNKPRLGDESDALWKELYTSHPSMDHNAIHDASDKLHPNPDDFDWLHGVLNGNAAVGSGVRGGGGADLYNSLGGGLQASSALSKLGIPGIRYLDGGSRGAGTGTSNFVLFDDQMPRILERNGVPTGQQPWKPGEWNIDGLIGRE